MRISDTDVRAVEFPVCEEQARIRCNDRLPVDRGVDRHPNAAVAADKFDGSCECDGEFAVGGDVAVPAFICGDAFPSSFSDDGADVGRWDH